MSDEPVRTQDQPEGGHQPQDEEASEGAWHNLTRSVRALAVSFGPSVVLDLLLVASVAATVTGTLPDPNQGLSARLLRQAATVGSVAPWAYLLVIRPWHLRWGATEDETRRMLPATSLCHIPLGSAHVRSTYRLPRPKSGRGWCRWARDVVDSILTTGLRTWRVWTSTALTESFPNFST